MADYELYRNEEEYEQKKDEQKMNGWIFTISLFFSFLLVFGFITENIIIIGNRRFHEKIDEPWFRVPHFQHGRVEAAEKETSAFGKHFVPLDDFFIPPDWTKRESQYLPCLFKKCVCPYYNGTIINGECHLPNGIVFKKAHRQEIRTLTDEKRKQFEDTLNKLKQNGIYNRLSRTHKYSGVHSGPAFTIWHREFLKRIELVIREYLPDPNMGVPYWDSTLDAQLPDPHDSIIFSDIFLGETDMNGTVYNGPYANWTTMEGKPHITRQFRSDPTGELLNEARVQWIINNPDINMILGTTMPLTTCPLNITLDPRILEYSHDYVHFFISGDMGKSYSSSNDVIFIYHHSMIDLIFETWRQNMQTRTQRTQQYPNSDEKCFPPWHNADSFMPMLPPYRNRDALSNGYTDEMYEFSARPSCSLSHPDCGSKYLFCYIPSPPDDPFCMSKVKMGGNCTGFDKWPICYDGLCDKEKCIPSFESSHPKRSNNALSQLYM